MIELQHLSVSATPDGRLTRRQAAVYLGIAERTLANWKSRRTGPPQIKIGGKVFYRLKELARFIEGANDK